MKKERKFYKKQKKPFCFERRGFLWYDCILWVMSKAALA